MEGGDGGAGRWGAAWLKGESEEGNALSLLSPDGDILAIFAFPLPIHLGQSLSPAPTPHKAGPQILVFFWMLEPLQAATDHWASSAH